MHSARGVRLVAERRTESVLLASGKISTQQTGSRPTGVSTSEHRAPIHTAGNRYIYIDVFIICKYARPFRVCVTFDRSFP
jgi:hypothetical protein